MAIQGEVWDPNAMVWERTHAGFGWWACPTSPESQQRWWVMTDLLKHGTADTGFVHWTETWTSTDLVRPRPMPARPLQQADEEPAPGAPASRSQASQQQQPKRSETQQPSLKRSETTSSSEFEESQLPSPKRTKKAT